MQRNFLIKLSLVIAMIVGVFAVRLFHGTVHVKITEAPVTTGPIARQIVATGTLQPVMSVEVSTQVSGTVQSLGADFNSLVHVGDVLVWLDPSSFEAARDQARAALTASQADAQQLQTAVDDARNRVTREEALLQGNLIPEADVDADRAALAEAQADLQSGIASVAQAQAALKQAEVNLRLTVIRSPVDGIVIARSVEVGQTLAATLEAPPLFKVATNFTHMEILAQIDESDIGTIHVGERATFTVDAYPSSHFSGAVETIRLQPADVSAPPPSATSGQTAAITAPGAVPLVEYSTVIDVFNPGEQLRPGMTATVTLDGPSRDRAMRIPNNALVFRPPFELQRPGADADAADRRTGPRISRVWEYTGGAFKPVDVSTGLSDDEWTEVVSGPLRDGDEVVTSASVESGQ